MPQSPPNTGENDTLELERQVGELLQSIEKTAEDIGRQLADDDGGGSTKMPAPVAPAAAKPAPATDTDESAEDTGADVVADGVAGEEAAVDAASADAAEVETETEAERESAETAPEGGDDLDEEVEQLIAEATDAAVEEVAAESMAKPDADAGSVDPESRGSWVTQGSEAAGSGGAAATGADIAPGAEAEDAPANIAEVDEQLSREAADVIDGNEDEGEFLSPSEIEERLDELQAEDAADDADADADANVDATPATTPTKKAPNAGKAAAPSKGVAATVSKAPTSGKTAPEREPRRLSSAPILNLAESVFMLINRPFSRLSKGVRDTIGWIALNTAFIAICIWIYLMLR